MAIIKKIEDLGRTFINGREKLFEDEFTKYINNSDTNKFVIISKEYICSSDKPHGHPVVLNHVYYIRVKHYNKKHYVGCRMTFISAKGIFNFLGSTNFDGFNVPYIEGKIRHIYKVDTKFLSKKKAFLFTGMAGSEFNIKELKKEFKFDFTY